MEKVLISPYSMDRADHWRLTKAILKSSKHQIRIHILMGDLNKDVKRQ